MAAISGRDASLLALLAEKPKTSSPVIKHAFFTLGPEAQEIAKALRGRQDVRERAIRTAKGLRDWVKSNKTTKIRRKAK
jgi:hypothetical protein